MRRESVSVRDLRATKLMLKTGIGHTLVVTGFEGSILEMEDLTFNLNSAVMLPNRSSDSAAAVDALERITGLAVLRACYSFAANNPNQRVVIAGHADASGESAAYNFKLSTLRADNVLCALMGDRTGWAKIAGQKHKIADYQQILLWASITYGWDCNPGNVDGFAGPLTEGALRRFQARYNAEFAVGMPIDGVIGPQTWGAFFDLYMRELAELMDTDESGLQAARSHIQFVDDDHKTVGCGASHPINSVIAASTRAPQFDTETGKVSLASGYRSSKDRRVEILFFSPAHEPDLSCHASASAPCQPAICEIYRGSFTLAHIPCEGAAIPRLKSRLALDWLEQAARSIDEKEFLAWASTVFGSDIPLDAYRAWRADVVAGNLNFPHIRLVAPAELDGNDGDYNNNTQEIRVAKDLPLRAGTNPGDAASLFLVLLHEFGHHVDNLLRRRYTNPPLDGDAPGEEGALFAFGIAGMNQDKTDHLLFATHRYDQRNHELKVEYVKLHQAVKDYVADPNKQRQAKQSTVEGFSPGRGRPNSNFFAHRSIEDGLAEVDSVFFSPLVRDRVYFGNWERDYSQFCGASTLRALQILQILQDPLVLQARSPADLPRRAITEYLGHKAREEFQNIQPTCVTTANLGVYRPEEHVDNPEGLTDDRSVDAAFRGPVDAQELVVDPVTGIKNYIAHDGQGWDTSTSYVSRSLHDAFRAGPTAEGFRLLGQALHTIEDFYAHSNFVELTLRRLGHDLVFPWVGLKSELSVNGDRRFPLVTGVFGFVDTMVSLVSSIGENLGPAIVCQDKVFSKTSVETLTLLLNALANTSPSGELMSPVEFIHISQDAVGKDLTAFRKALCDASEGAKTWLRRKLGALLRGILWQLALLENEFIKDIPTSERTNPTHSMLSKDHPDNPLHAIAATCARAAVGRVGLAMRDTWNGAIPISDAAAVATGFFIHPNDIPFLSGDARADLVLKIDTFATTNPAVIGRLDVIGAIDTFRKHNEVERDPLSRLVDAMVDYDYMGALRSLTLLPQLDPHIFLVPMEVWCRSSIPGAGSSGW